MPAGADWLVARHCQKQNRRRERTDRTPPSLNGRDVRPTCDILTVTPLCRRHHRAKLADGWRPEQPQRGRRWLESQGICQRLGAVLPCVVAGWWNL
jgi:hypothetical protein